MKISVAQGEKGRFRFYVYENGGRLVAQSGIAGYETEKLAWAEAHQLLYGKWWVMGAILISGLLIGGAIGVNV